MVSVMEKQLIPAGYKLTEVGVIPEDWRVETLSNVCEKITDGTHDTPKPTTLGVPFLTAIHVKENRIDFESCYYLPKSIHDEIYRRCNPQKNDVLMVNIGAGVATSALVNVDYEFSLKNVALLKPSKQKIIGAYLNSYQSYVKNKVYESLATGGAQPFLSLFQIGQLKISLPSVQEQTAIANALSDVDALIAALEKLINKKSAIKTAAMQQLLTGKKRLPPFDQLKTGYKQTELGEIPGDWEVVQLTELAEIVGGSTPSTSNMQYWNGTINWFTPTELDGRKFAIESRRKLTNKGLQNCSAKVLPVNTILMTTRASIGDLMILKEEAATNQGFQSLVARKNTHFEFLYYMMATKKEALLQQASGSTFLEISPNKVKSLVVLTPSLDEQVAIANVLSDMDKDLEALQQRLYKTQKIKQGMMQELLTGKTRLV